MYNRRIIGACAIMVMLGFVMLAVVSVPPAKVVLGPSGEAQFVLAEWDYPDEYGQGIEAIEVYENSTGSWVLYDTYFYDDETILEWNASVAIKFFCWTWFNSTLVGVSTTNEGKRYQQHDVIVTSVETTVFSQQNFTYQYADSGIEPPLWYYGYMVVLNFLPVSGAIYTVTINYEVFY